MEEDNKLKADNELPEEIDEMEEKSILDDKNFIKGLFAGVILVLACLTLVLFWYRWKLNRELEELRASRQVESVTGEEEKVEETDAELELNDSRIAQKLDELEQLINLYYLDGVDNLEVEDGIYTGLVDALGDPYSVYYDEEDLSSMEELTNGEYAGIGAVMSQDPETMEVTVVMCYDGTPSKEAGMLPGDILISLNGEDITGQELSTIVAKIKTGETTPVTIGLIRDGEEMELEVGRRQIEIPTVDWEMLEDQIGYIQILEFDSITVSQFEQAMKELEEAGMEKLIVDVRDNPGGVLQVVCDILDQLLPEGLIVYTEDKYGHREEYYSDAANSFEKPLVVLINGNSASASEVFSGAIKDYGLGTLVGTTTYGKGIVQRIFNLNDGTGVKLTISKYYTPNGNDIHKKGIEPDVEVELNDYDQETLLQITEENWKEYDNQMQEAIRILEEE